MRYKNLRDFIDLLYKEGELQRVPESVSPILEMTHLCDKVLRADGPALLFDAPHGYKHRVLGNLFGTPKRVAMGMGASNTDALREIGRTLAYLKEPEPPKGMRDALDKLPLVKQVLSMAPKDFSEFRGSEMMRFSYANSMNNLETAIERIRLFNNGQLP